MALTLITGPAVEPISLADAKLQVRRGDTTEDDAVLTWLRTAVRERAENATNRALITQTWDLVLDAFPNEDFIEVPKPPLQSITYVKYRDTSGVLQTWASSKYVVEAPAGPRCRRGRLSLAYGEAWPVTYQQAGDVTIRFICGYGADLEDVPVLLKAAMLMDLAALYDDRSAGIVEGSRVHGIYRAHWSAPTQRRAA